MYIMDVLRNYVDTTRIHFTEDYAYIDECVVLKNFQGFKKGEFVNVCIELISWNVYINDRKIHFGIYENCI
jgi:predicted phosphatase